MSPSKIVPSRSTGKDSGTASDRAREWPAAAGVAAVEAEAEEELQTKKKEVASKKKVARLRASLLLSRSYRAQQKTDDIRCELTAKTEIVALFQWRFQSFCRQLIKNDTQRGKAESIQRQAT